MKRQDVDVCVCVLAHNEQKHIAKTIHAIRAGNGEIEFDIVVYANGCTDATARIVQELSTTLPNVYLREITEASKPNAWNFAFEENKHSILVFSDGDVEPEPGGVFAVYKFLKRNRKLSLVCCQFWPFKKGLSLEKKIVGFVQIPIIQDFLSGQFYAIRRADFQKKFLKLGILGLPKGIVAEDVFIESLVHEKKIYVTNTKVYYEPPKFDDYLKYLARLRWQDEQLKLVYAEYFQSHFVQKVYWQRSFLKKMSKSNNIGRLFIGMISTAMRYSVKFLFKKKIDTLYKWLGPVGEQGDSILSCVTRSLSSK